MTKAEYDALLAEGGKIIEADISWSQDKSLSYVSEFFVKLESESGYPLTIKGSYNRVLKKNNYTLFSPKVGRIFAVDYDRKHGDAGEFHVHSWDGTKCVATKAVAPAGIEGDPVRLWKWFCEQAGIIHSGTFGSPPPLPPSDQNEMF